MYVVSIMCLLYWPMVRKYLEYLPSCIKSQWGFLNKGTQPCHCWSSWKNNMLQAPGRIISSFMHTSVLYDCKWFIYHYRYTCPDDLILCKIWINISFVHWRVQKLCKSKEKIERNSLTCRNSKGSSRVYFVYWSNQYYLKT